MSLRWKLLLFVAASAIAVIGAVYVTSELIFMRRFQNIENLNAQQQAKAAATDLNNIVLSMNTLNHNLANRADTYDYVMNPASNSGYINNNASDGQLMTDNINFLFILDNSGKVIFSKGYSFANNQDMSIPQTMDQYLTNENLTQLTVNDSISGLVLTPEGVLMLSSQPILASPGQGPVGGTMVMARLLDATEVMQLYKMVTAPLTVVNVNQANIPPDISAIESSLTLHASTMSHVIDSKTIAGYVLLPDIFGQPALILKVTMPRTVSQQGIETMRYFIFSLIGLTLLFILIVNLLLTKVVISRVGQVAQYVTDISKSGNLSKRLIPTGNDEITSLKKGINEMVGTLQESQNLLQLQRESEQKLRLTIESVAEGIMTIDLKGHIVDINDANLRLHGCIERKEMIGKNISDLMEEGCRGKFQESLEKTLQTGRTGSNEFTMLKSDGNTFFSELSLALLRDPEGKAIGFVIGTKDITVRKQAEANLRSEKELIERILDTVPNAVLVINEQGRIELANRTFNEQFGKSKGTLEGELLQEIIPVRDLSQAVSDTRLKRNQKEQFEFKYFMNGSERIFASSILWMETDEILLVLADITQERERQERLYLTDRLASVGEMAAGIAHELNNPLTSVMGLSQLLLDDDVPPEMKEDLEGIHSEARRAAGVVKNMLTFARKHAPKKETTQINRIIEDVIKLRAYEHRVNNIAIESILDPNLPEISVDYFQIQQVFLNITLNAEQEMIKAHKKGTLRIVTGRIDSHVKISFIDDGSGISPENMSKLFSPFFTTKEVGKGTGLGLSICYGIIKNHNGKIYATSEFGQGATFVVELPIETNRLEGKL